MEIAVIKTGGKQYLVEPGKKLKIEKLEAQEGSVFSFDKVLLYSDGKNIEIGTPYIKDAQVEAKIEKQGKSKKIIIFKYHSKTRYRKKKGHRQPYTLIEISKIKKREPTKAGNNLGRPSK